MGIRGRDGEGGTRRMSRGAARMPCEGGAPTITFIGVTDINVVSRSVAVV